MVVPTLAPSVTGKAFRNDNTPCSRHRNQNRSRDRRRLNGDRDDHAQQHGDHAASLAENNVECAFHPLSDQQAHVAGNQRQRQEHNHYARADHQRPEDVAAGPHRLPEILDPTDGFFDILFDRTLPLGAGIAQQLTADPLCNARKHTSGQFDGQQNRHRDHVEEVMDRRHAEGALELFRLAYVSQRHQRVRHRCADVGTHNHRHRVIDLQRSGGNQTDDN